MFKLQRLEITGFKSFADYTEIVFTGNGITAIVGPNGCGKSNVADAISWVLGEQKVKNLRGGEMKDVIFQGAKSRQPSGMAEVVLHMVRDETFEEEQDIEDIDATLEELDDHAGAVEERLSPELEAMAPQPEAAPTNGDGVAPVEATQAEGEAAQALAPPNVEAATAAIGPPPPLPRRRERVPPQRPRLPPARHPGPLLGYRPFGRALRHHRAGAHRPNPFGQADGSPHADRRGRRHHQVPRAPARRRGPPGSRAREPQPRLRHHQRDRASGRKLTPSGRESAALPPDSRGAARASAQGLRGRRARFERAARTSA